MRRLRLDRNLERGRSMTGAARGLLIFPYNGNGLEALSCLGDRFRLEAFVDDTTDKLGRDRWGHEVRPREAFDLFADRQVLAVPGGPNSFRRRMEIIHGLGISPDRYATVIHPRANVSPLATIGRNVLLMAGVIVTSNAVVGDHVCVLPNTVLHHDVVVGAYTLIGSNVTVAGGASLGENCYIGSGTSIRNGVAIGARALVGLASNVVRDVPPDATVAGNPARPLARHVDSANLESNRA
jgi:sugar O-acyltransferase (sialic acid O-acetyltransferase NeuD family)